MTVICIEAYHSSIIHDSLGCKLCLSQKASAGLVDDPEGNCYRMA